MSPNSSRANSQPLKLDNCSIEKGTSMRLQNAQSDQEANDRREHLLKVMPRVTATGGVPNGREIEGILFHFSQEKVRVVCVCHGYFPTPGQFVQHAGGTDLENPMRLIHVSSSSSLSEDLAVSPESPAQVLTRLANKGNKGSDRPLVHIKEINLTSSYDPERGTQNHQCNYHPNTDQMDLNLSLSLSGDCGNYRPILPKESMPPTSSPSAAIGVGPTPRRMSWKQRARAAHSAPQEKPPSVQSEAAIEVGPTPRRRMSWKKRAREAHLVPQEMPPSVLPEAAIGVGPTPRRRISWKQRAREAHRVPQEEPPSILLSEAAIGVGPTSRRRYVSTH